MKKVIVVLALVFVGLYTNAQQKIGYINSQEILSLMPEYSKVMSDLDVYKKTWIDQSETLQKDFEAKLKAYQDGSKNMSDALKTAKEQELQKMQSQLSSLEETAQDKIREKFTTLMEPVNKKANNAIEAVAKEKGYSYILDVSAGAILYALPSDSILDAVKAKLGIKDQPAPAGGSTTPKSTPKK